MVIAFLFLMKRSRGGSILHHFLLLGRAFLLEITFLDNTEIQEGVGSFLTTYFQLVWGAAGTFAALDLFLSRPPGLCLLEFEYIYFLPTFNSCFLPPWATSYILGGNRGAPPPPSWLI